jgi:hypothetical protein
MGMAADTFPRALNAFIHAIAIAARPEEVVPEEGY